MRDVAGKVCAVLIERVQPAAWEKAARREDGVQGGARVSFAENESVTLRPAGLAGINTQYSPVKDHQQFDHRERGSYVRTVRAMRHPENVGTSAPRQTPQILKRQSGTHFLATHSLLSSDLLPEGSAADARIRVSNKVLMVISRISMSTESDRLRTYFNPSLIFSGRINSR